MESSELQPYTFPPRPEDISTTLEEELLQAADRRELLCPRCDQPLTADWVASEVYQGVLLSCLEGCGWREL